MLTVEQPKMGIILKERVVKPWAPELKRQASFECGSWDGPLRTSLVTMWELIKPSLCPHPNAGLIWDMTADVKLDLDYDGSLHDLAVMHHLLALKIVKQDGRPTTEFSEGHSPVDWMKQSTCLASSCGMERNVCGTGHCLNSKTELKIGGWREENEMNLKVSEVYHRPAGSKYLVDTSSAPYCNSKYPTHMVVLDARTQQVLVDQLFSVQKCVRLARMSERSNELLTKIIRAVLKRSEAELQMKWVKIL